MSMRTLIFVFLALIVAGGTAMVARQRLSQSRVEIKQEVAQQAAPAAYVLVASRDMPAGTVLHEDDATWQSWPDDQINDAYLVKGKGDAHILAGAVLRFRIFKGEPVTAGRFVAPGEHGFLAAVLSPGMRATSVTLTTASDIAGLILPGDRVDIILSHPVKDELQLNASPRMVSETILTNIRVVAIDQVVNDLDKKPISGKTATFEVTPKQAEIIEVGKSLGNLNLVLRSVGGESQNDGSEADTGSVSYTVDNEVSPLIHHPDGNNHDAVDVTILRGNIPSPDTIGAGAAPAPSAAAALPPPSPHT